MDPGLDGTGSINYSPLSLPLFICLCCCFCLCGVACVCPVCVHVYAGTYECVYIHVHVENLASCIFLSCSPRCLFVLRWPWQLRWRWSSLSLELTDWLQRPLSELWGSAPHTRMGVTDPCHHTGFRVRVEDQNSSPGSCVGTSVTAISPGPADDF